MYNPPLDLGIRKKMRNQNMLFNHRKWNILAFRGRLMSLLVLTHSGVSPRPHLPQESRIFDLLGWAFILNGFSPSHFHKCFNYHNTNHRIDYRSLSRSTVTLIGTEGGDSCGNSMSLETPECEAHGGSSHARGKRPAAVEINSPAHIQKLTHPLQLFLLFLRITWRGS